MEKSIFVIVFLSIGISDFALLISKIRCKTARDTSSIYYIIYTYAFVFGLTGKIYISSFDILFYILAFDFIISAANLIVYIKNKKNDKKELKRILYGGNNLLSISKRTKNSVFLPYIFRKNNK